MSSVASAPVVPASLRTVASPWTLGPLQLPNRVVMGSMHTGLEVHDDGGAGMAAFYRERAAGGAACIITGGIAVNDEARGGPDFAVFGVGGADERFRVAVDAVHDEGGTILAQLFHAGRYALASGMTDRYGEPQRVVAPSALPWAAARGVVPSALTGDEIARTIEDFAAAARTAREIGFDGVEIMASEGYLINQFQSPLTNLRDDEWGGSPERRRRFAVEVVRAVRDAVPDIAVTIRLSGADLMPGSSTPDDVDALVLELLPLGLDGISVGIGWHESRTPTVQASVPHGAWVSYVTRIADLVRASEHPDVRVIASNRMTDLRDGEAVLSGGVIDAVALARPFLADPAIVNRSLGGRFALVNTCIGCNQACLDRSIIGQPVSCLVNPRAAREVAFPARPTTDPKRVDVVGGGPAGLAAAVDAARRGHAVTLWEASEQLGGQFGLAALVPGKEDYAATVRSARAELDERGATIHLGRAATAADLADSDAVVLAPGVVPREVDIPGATLPHVRSYEQALREGVPAGTVAIIGGGGIGVDTAAFLTESPDEVRRAEEFAARWDLDVSEVVVGDVPQRLPAATRTLRPGEQVTVLRRSGKFGQGIGITSRWVAIGRLRDAGVQMVGGVQEYLRIEPGALWIRDEHGEERAVPADHVVICAGQERAIETGDEPDRRPTDGLVTGLQAAGVPYAIVGGARDARSVDAVRATSEALEAVRRLAP
ncbi:2,4-dienoyl-CoA reductase (NADPH2) [Curtobacterium sp. UNCCL20]|uniref:oxidoreductase n=1 Tax=Curtobacterium sp. UNCCL20 TaxID=1502773 RepID=UPI000881BF54|nr:FAD-dependent oxidoreductase [Curtobacterium sp. UNCCL20]SDQ82725.1 2,4-dienoyl-CoA reductase (NADPH2) [Curtobacterium sp. UNCCL20]